MYEAYLRGLLAPLGVYDLSDSAVNAAELHALGRFMDAVSAKLDEAERESHLTTAEDEGLRRRESLLARKPAASTFQERRAAIAALFQIAGDSLTPEAINRTIRGCGIRARATEKGDGEIRITFPDKPGVPDEFDKIQKIILDILPCHLAVEFYFRYLTWRECEAERCTWQTVQAYPHTWQTFQLSVPPED